MPIYDIIKLSFTDVKCLVHFEMAHYHIWDCLIFTTNYTDSCSLSCGNSNSLK